MLCKPNFLTILHTNDFHGHLNADRKAVLALARSETNLYFDSGDIIKAGNLSVPLTRDDAWKDLADLQCTASVLGNRETHPLAQGFKAKVLGVSHPLLCANLRGQDGSRPLAGEWRGTVRNLRVGVIGLSVPMVTERMASRALSAYLWDPPLEVGEALIRKMRPEVDVLIALTHIGHREDLKLAAMGGVDIIFGGHSHTVIDEPQLVGKTWICQGGSHGRFYGKYCFGEGELTGGLIPF